MSNKKAQNRKRVLLKKFKTLSRVMSPRGDIKITVSGNSAYTNFKEINVPAGDFSDDNYVELLEGAIDHEIGHIDETDPDASNRARELSSLHNTFRQIFEDVRMERLRMQKYPGTRRNLDGLVRQAIDRGWFQEPAGNEHPAQLLQAYLLYQCRSYFCEQVPLRAFAVKARRYLCTQLPNQFTADLDAIIGDIPGLNSNWDSLAMAEKVIELIKKLQDDNQNNSGDSDGSESGDGQDGDSDGSESGDGQDGDSDGSESGDGQDGDSDGSESGDGQDGDSDGSESGDGQDGDSDGSESGDGQDGDSDGSESGDGQDGDSDGSESGDGQDGDSDGSEPGDDPDGSVNLGARMLNADESDLMDELDDLVRRELEKEASEASDDDRINDYLEANVSDINRYFCDGHMDKAVALQASRRVSVPLQRAMFDLNKTGRSWRKRGQRVDSNRLAMVPAGVRSVFKHEKITKAPNTAVSILVDSSCSMGCVSDVNGVQRPRGWIMKTANACAFSLVHALEKIPGVESEVLYYPHRNSVDLHLAKDFMERANAKHFEVSASGYSTPTAEAMVASLRRLAIRPEPKKMMFVLTDGDPDSTEAVVDAISMAETCGVSVTAFGIATDHVRGFEDTGFVSVNDVSELHLAVRDAISSSLMQVG